MWSQILGWGLGILATVFIMGQQAPWFVGMAVFWMVWFLANQIVGDKRAIVRMPQQQDRD
jgi:hypothetical protein